MARFCSHLKRLRGNLCNPKPVYFLKKTLKSQSEFLEESFPLNVIAATPSATSAEASAVDSTLSKEYPFGMETNIFRGKFSTSEMVPSSEFFEESNLADLNSKPLWAICLSVARICGAGEQKCRFAHSGGVRACGG